MTLRVRFTPTADAEFLAVITYIGADSPSAAVAFRDKALHTLSRLRDFPDSGRTLAEYPALPFREVIVVPYRFFYQVKVDAVWIDAVWYGAQLIKPLEDVVSGQQRHPADSRFAAAADAKNVIPTPVRLPVRCGGAPAVIDAHWLDRYTVRSTKDVSMSEATMETVTISPKYQVVIPKGIRESLELRPGQKVEAILYDRRIELVPVRPISEMRGFLPGLDSSVPRDDDRV